MYVKNNDVIVLTHCLSQSLLSSLRLKSRNKSTDVCIYTMHYTAECYDTGWSHNIDRWHMIVHAPLSLLVLLEYHDEYVRQLSLK